MMAKFYSKGFYEGMNGKSKQEAADGAMMGKQRGFANMPEEAIRKTYTSTQAGLKEVIDDTQKGIDAQISADIAKMNKHRNKA